MLRAAARPAPRLGVTLAGVGVGMMVMGALIWPGEEVGGGGDGGRWLGMGLSAALVAAGYGLLLRWGSGPLGTAGVAATTLGVPLLLGFATFDFDDVVDENEDLAITLPFQLDVIVLVSIVAWMASYLFVPGARGHNFYLAASTFVLWLYVLDKIEPGAAGYLLSLPFGFVFFFLFLDSGTQIPDPTAVGVASMMLGAVYYGAAQWLDRAGSRGTGTPFYVTGFLATGVGIAHLSAEIHEVATGLLLLAVSPFLAFLGVHYQRRFTAWIWGFGIGLGLLLVAFGVLEDTETGFGVAAIVLGGVLVAIAHAVSGALGEGDETDPVPPVPTAAPVAGPPGESG